MKKIPIALIAVMSVFLQTACTKRPAIPATSDKLVVSGRAMHMPQAQLKYDYPGVAVRVRFEGTALYAEMQDTSNYFNVLLDGEFLKVIKGKGVQAYPLATGLSDGVHEVKLIKRTEAEVGATTLKRFTLPEGGRFLKAYENSRKIEVIGNSITCGYGTEAPHSASYTDSTADAWDSYAYRLGEFLQAEVSLVAYSGKGAVRNYNDSAQVSQMPMPAHYENTMVFGKEKRWQFRRWVPDVVVINLGTNDFSTQPHPAEMQFIGAYKKLLKNVHHNYSEQMPILCLCGPLMQPPACQYIQKAAAEYAKTQGVAVKFLSIPSGLLDQRRDFGADAHPSVSGQQKIAGFILPELKDFMNW